MSNSYQLGYYLAVYLDILGQSEKLEELKRLPTNQAEKDEAEQILADTAGKVVNLRNTFQAIFDAMKKPTGKLNGLPPDKRKQADSLRELTITKRGIADSYIITMPLRDEEWGLKKVMLNIYGVLGATCSTILIGLTDGMMIRGGADIGWGTILPVDNEDEIYGAAVTRAVRYERDIARYPRVVVGEELWKYLCWVEKEFDRSGKDSSFIKNSASDCKKFIWQDHDGAYILDYLGEGMHSLEIKGAPQLVDRAYNIVVKEHRRLIENKNYELAGRCSLLRQYIESRLHLWDIDKKRWSDGEYLTG